MAGLKWALLGSVAATMSLGAAGLAQGIPSPFELQVQQGRTLYAANCAACHGAGLDGGQFAAGLKGPAFMASWSGVPASDLFDYISTSMPPGGSASLGEAEYEALTALILAENGGTSQEALSAADMAAFAQVTIPLPDTGPGEEGNGIGLPGITNRYPFPAAPDPVDRFANYTPVTSEQLANPEPENWLTWRRGHEGHGFSPLTQIDRSNVDDLQVAWSQALPPGPTMDEPIVRDGVLYVFGFGDEVFAFDAVNGRQLWRYRRRLPEGTAPLSKKTMALWDDKLVIATSDLHMMALDARTGRPVWDVAVPDAEGLRSNGGPLVADGVAMIGFASQRDGGSVIQAFDATTGEHLWTFNTIAQDGTPGGDTWNGLANEDRHGGSVWTSGTYDPETGLALWGVAQTYDTGPVRDVLPGMNNDGLYTNSTLAFAPRTGKLVWYFQHQANDQYDLDWVFERVVGKLEVDGEERRVIITGGKDGLIDTLDAETGEYLSTYDMGFQDYIVAIDPETGRKTPDPALLPGRDRPAVFMCPHAGGGRNWSPNAFVESTGMMFGNYRDTCMELRPRAEGGFLTSGVDVFYSAPADSDGMFGILQGIDMKTGEVRWENRRRAPYDTGILATAGGLLFAGGMDREFLAFDQDSGEQLWRSALTGVPNASPVTYSVDGRQYVAVVTGAGNPLSFGLPNFTPELPEPEINSAAVTVYALPEN
ncbi:PQQ-binding-like beta-propeller repeat protein [Alteraurantiacibacter aquimixticola]|uniref:Cytochrome c domain-containing protein n=1 Tax=Alteraurantiacibacter aquimixticola TaxID=2489173 RepID=A0A4T3F781_9SPHN|nr:PQQ-binding-like beta-propeller repeat protein [Alteraurantiacibacter aquimixticola]TIX51562.1 hypothetical protein E5222_03665 [Alteraurantiacibacter aquimixticola]